MRKKQSCACSLHRGSEPGSGEAEALLLKRQGRAWERRNVSPISRKHLVDAVNDNVHIIFSAKREKAVLFPVDINRQARFSQKLKHLFFKIWIKFLDYYKTINSGKGRRELLFPGKDTLFPTLNSLKSPSKSLIASCV